MPTEYRVYRWEEGRYFVLGDTQKAIGLFFWKPSQWKLRWQFDLEKFSGLKKNRGLAIHTALVSFFLVWTNNKEESTMGD